MTQYYNNKSKYPTCVPLPKKESDYLAIENALSELYSQDLKNEAIKNLGLDILLSNLKSLINLKIYQLDLPAYDLLPEEDSENLVKSGGIYNALLDYVKHSSLNELTEWLQTIINNRIDPLANTLNELVNRYDLFVKNTFSLDLGTSTESGISLKTLTEYINALTNRINALDPSYNTEVTLTISPKERISKTSENVLVRVNGNNNVLQRVKVYINNELILEVTPNTTTFETTLELDKTSTIKTVSTVLEEQYSNEEVFTKHYPYYIGSGNAYTDVIKLENLRPYDNSFAGVFDVTVDNNNEQIIVIIPEEQSILSIKLSGFNVPFTSEIVNGYNVYHSINRYKQGTYLIEIV